MRIGCGAGFQGDRIEPANVLAARGALDVLVFECLAERTIALAQLRRKHDPNAGCDPLLERRLEGVLPAVAKGLKVVTNMGAANPVAAAGKAAALARRHGVKLKVAAVTGDDVLDRLDTEQPALETGEPLRASGPIVSANAYLGADAILPALAGGADIVITGRVADPSLVLAALVWRFGWEPGDLDRLARGTVVGHLLECAGQLTGGYFADPGRKDVAGLADLGFPFADVDADGNAVLGKVAGTGGVIDLRTATEQLLYEVTDPSAYLTPDITADFTSVALRAAGPDAVAVSGGRGRKRPDTLKVSVGYHAGFRGEGEIGYAGENCIARAKLAGEIVAQRLRGLTQELRVDLIGMTALHSRPFPSEDAYQPYETRLRVAGRAGDEAIARRIAEEVEALYTNGPAGGGGVRTSVVEQIGIVSCLIPREQAVPRVTFVEA